MSDTKILTNLDYPDPDVIRVGDTYYMASTTMHFMPGCNILSSKDLVSWEHESYVYDILEDTKQERLEELSAYGKGMWAPSLRYYKGKFYVCFVANDVQKTFLFIAEDIKGPWKKQYIEGFYHDPSLFFDDDDCAYIIYGNTQIHLTQLNETLTGKKEGGLDRVIVREPEEHPKYLGYEGAHFYKINGTYYVTLIHWPPKEKWSRRTEAVFCAKSLEDDFTGGDVFDEDGGYNGMGIAQGGIVDTPNGEYYAILFQDRGAAGRIPVLLPVTFENEFPVFGKGTLKPLLNVKENVLLTSSFYEKDASKENPKLSPYWQWNHIPDLSLVDMDVNKQALTIKTGKLCVNPTRAINTLTQRALSPRCHAEVTLDAGKLCVGDIAGFMALQSHYGFIGVRRDEEGFVLTYCHQLDQKPSFPRPVIDDNEGEFLDICRLNDPCVRLRIDFVFANEEETKPIDEVTFSYEENGLFKTVSEPLKIWFSLDHFTGYRFALFNYATKTTGGQATFFAFSYYDALGNKID